MKKLVMRLERYVVSLLAAVMVMVSMQAVAAEQPGGRDFNHMTTGFPLSGAHATAACETCHVGGVLKGTPRDCDGCHAVGRRVVATPKHSAHIVTDAPCESCHFSTSTFLGARYNHGTAKQGQCVTCHNGRIARSKHAAHVVTNSSCDQCHRTSTWSPASWNHTGAQYAGQDCKACHNAAGPGRNYTTVAKHSAFQSMGISGCNSCHTNYSSFYSHYYNHQVPAVTACDGCHANATYAAVVTQATSPIHATATTLGITNCESCHTRNYATFSGARYRHNDAAYNGKADCLDCHNGTYPGVRAKPATHIQYLSPATTQCKACHYTTGSWVSVVGWQLHVHLTTTAAPHNPTCRSCHAGAAHDGDEGASPSMDCSMSGCHSPAGGRGSAFVNWD
ncbi:MAG TPA: hypothetical protein VGD24_09990 [Gallionella sp.]